MTHTIALSHLIAYSIGVTCFQAHGNTAISKSKAIWIKVQYALYQKRQSAQNQHMVQWGELFWCASHKNWVPRNWLVSFFGAKWLAVSPLGQTKLPSILAECKSLKEMLRMRTKGGLLFGYKLPNSGQISRESFSICSKFMEVKSYWEKLNESAALCRI